MALSVVFDSLALHTEPNGPFLVHADGIDLGTQQIVDFFQGLRMEEFDQAAAEARLTRQVVIPVRVKNTTMDAAITNQKAVLSRIAAANRSTPKTLTITPNGSSTTSTFKVYGGSFESTYTQGLNLNKTDDAVLTLYCDPWVYGVAENLGSAGSPLALNAASPANVTLTPTIAGDVPGDVVLFVKNRHATNSARSLMVGSISGDTTWTALVDSSTWTLDADGTADATDATTKNTHKVKKTGTINVNQLYKIAHWTAPTLPTDRRFTVWLRVNDASSSASTPNKRGNIQFRLRHVTGQAEVVGEWRSVPSEANDATWVGAEMGTLAIPVTEVSPAGAPTTTVYLEMLSLSDITAAAGIHFDYALYMPEDSSVVFETADTTKTIAGAAATVRIDQDQIYTTGGIPAGAVAKGPHIRARGTSRFVVHLSTGFIGTLDATMSWDFLNVDAYATYTPRGFHLM